MWYITKKSGSGEFLFKTDGESLAKKYATLLAGSGVPCEIFHQCPDIGYYWHSSFDAFGQQRMK